MRTTYCYNDIFTWGRELHACIDKRKGSVQMFTHALQVPDDHCVCTFLHISAKERDYTKELNEELGLKKNITQIPTFQEARLHDERLMQYRTFGAWMPTTYALHSLEDVSQNLNELPYPIISYSSARAEMNKRLWDTPGDAFAEAMQAFSHDGIVLKGGGFQKKYVFWQIPVDRGQGHWHVFMAAKRYAVITQVETPEYKIATTEILNERLVELLKYVYAFVSEFGFNWVSVEVVAGTDPVQQVSSPFVISISTSWPFAWFQQGGMVFESENGMEWETTGVPAVHVWDVIAEGILKGRFDG